MKRQRVKRVVRIKIEFELLFHNDGVTPVPDSTGVVQLKKPHPDVITDMLKENFRLVADGTIDLRPGAKYSITMGTAR